MAAEDSIPRDFAQALIELQRPLFAYILALCHRPADAEEILQNTNLKVLAEADRPEEVRNFEGWTRRLAFYEYLAHAKRAGRNRLSFLDAEQLQDLAGASAARMADADRRLAALEQCTARLSPQDQQLLLSRYQDGLSIPEIASRTRRSRGAVRQVLYRIRSALMDCVRLRLAGPEAAT